MAAAASQDEPASKKRRVMAEEEGGQEGEQKQAAFIAVDLIPVPFPFLFSQQQASTYAHGTDERTLPCRVRRSGKTN